MKEKIKFKLTVKQIAAAIALLLGVILAIGYPTGGVKAKKDRRITIRQAHTIQKSDKHLTPAVKNKTAKKKKRVVPIVPPAGVNDTQDEGC